MKKCLFCHSDLVTTSDHPQQRTNEHIFPKWLLERYGIKKMQLAFSFLEAHSEDGISLQLTPPETRRSLSLNAFLLGNICASCNNGWMSELEERTKPDLIALHDGTPAKIEDKNSLSIWCAKTSFVLSSYLRPNVGALPENWGELLYARPSNLPDNTAVFYSPITSTRYWFSIPSTHEIRASNQADAQRAWRCSSKVVFQIGRAAFQVVWSNGATEFSHRTADSILINATIQVSPEFGVSIRNAGISDDLFVFMMSNSIIA